MCVVAKDLVEDCEGLLGDSTSEVVRHADHLLAQAQQYVRSEQDTNPATNDCIEANFSREEELLQLVKGLGQLYTGENEELVTLLPPPLPPVSLPSFSSSDQVTVCKLQMHSSWSHSQASKEQPQNEDSLPNEGILH